MHASAAVAVVLLLAALAGRPPMAAALPPVTGPIDPIGPIAPPPPPPPDPDCVSNADCDDGNPCNGVETCRGATIRRCVAGEEPLCLDADPCTIDSCDPVGGCRHQPAACPTTTTLPPESTTTTTPSATTSTTTTTRPGDACVSPAPAAFRYDPQFADGKGITYLDLAVHNIFHDVALGRDGRITIGGEVGDYPDPNRLFVARYTSDGRPDGSFGLQGNVFLGTAGAATAVLADADGVIVRGTENGQATVFRLDSAGRLVTPGIGGALPLLGPGDNGASADLVRLADGRIVVAGWESTGLFSGFTWIARLTPDLHLDPSFGAGTEVKLPIGPHNRLHAVTVGSRGPVVLGAAYADDGGSPSGEAHHFLARLVDTGALDPTFGVGGSIPVEHPSERLQQYHFITAGADDALTIGATVRLPDGQPVFALLRRRADGQPDTAWGSGGQVTIAPPCDFETSFLHEAHPLGDGRLLLAGVAFREDPRARAVLLAMIDAQGRFDPAFGHGGVALIETPAPGPFFQSSALQPDGKLVVAGTQQEASGTTGVLARIDLGCAAAPASSCDDGDPCTTDACSNDATCAHVERPGLAYIACVLDERLSPLLRDAHAETAGRARRLATRSLARERRASALLARVMGGKASPRLLARSMRLVASITRMIERGHERLGAARADAITGELAVVTARLRAVVQEAGR